MTGFLEGHQANGAFVAVGPPGKSHPHFSGNIPVDKFVQRIYGTRAPETRRLRSANVRNFSPVLWRLSDSRCA